jgi:transposase
VLGLGEVDEDELYAALDLLGRSQAGVEKILAQRHLKDGVLVLYDVTSSYLEGRRCELAQFGLSRDHRGDRPQIVFGLMCTPEGCPVAVEVFEGNLGDPSTLAVQVRKLRTRFRLKRIVLVGDRGMITNARIDADLAPAGFDWITALRAPAIKALAAEGGPLQLSLFDERDMAEIAAPDAFPGERLICESSDLI